MNTIAQQDFSEFLNFIKTLSIERVTHDDETVAEIRKAHVQFLALLTTVGELISDIGSAKNQFDDDYAEVGKKYLSEVISDSSEFIICMLIGLHRSSGGTLRSAIESYLKAFSSKEKPLILQRTSVPEVFNDAEGATFFSSKIGKRVIADLKGIYNELNAYVHTVSDNHMFGAIAIGSFPRWSDKNVKLAGLFIRVIRLFLYGIVGTRRDLYDRFDHRNKVITNRAMTRLQRRSAMGIDE
ncbi:hypothetical protein [Xanthomonas arboricola]|uniref:hypothetical protein n=1 Tax=Xanthomonas arboricola TaxID=56448 RepID=UPI00063EC57E|nr:hypothetical protein [Xanthomonas arboricola]MBB3846906.1 hypothetical protein [Xanthomonas arboricola]PPT20734.1 hypothetical protein XarbCFBP7629_13125 [Xanthomonas arboricola]